MGRLGDLLCGVQSPAIESTNGDPAHEHRPVAPAAHGAREPADAAVEVLDRVSDGRPCRSDRLLGVAPCFGLGTAELLPHLDVRRGG
jgi:hypothetical protein